jgi:hypothetical protein
MCHHKKLLSPLKRRFWVLAGWEKKCSEGIRNVPALEFCGKKFSSRREGF